MMNSMTLGPGFLFLWGLHILSVIAFFIGVLFLIFWAFKNLNEKSLWKWGWVFVVVSTVVCLLTLVFLPFGSYGPGPVGMIGHTGVPITTSESVPTGVSTSQSKEEADGKAFYDKLQAKQVNCSELSDSNFELIGEYVMGQRAGASHEQMNTMIKQMMGGDDAPMHIFLGKNATGCTTGTQSSQPFRGMMNGGGMMGGSANASSNAAPIDGHHTSSVTQ